MRSPRCAKVNRLRPRLYADPIDPGALSRLRTKWHELSVPRLILTHKTRFAEVRDK